MVSQGSSIKEIVIYGDDTVGDVLDKINAVIVGKATLTPISPVDELREMFDQLGPMGVHDEIVTDHLGLVSLSEASAVKLSLAAMTPDTLSRLAGVDASYRAALLMLFDDPSATDAEVFAATNVAPADVAKLRAIKDHFPYSDDDIEFLTGLDAMGIAVAREKWATAHSTTPTSGNSSVPGTIVIRSSLPGYDGRIELGGSEELIRALGINTIREASEPIFRASVYDAHSGATVASNVRFSGSVLAATVDPNIDVSFDASELITAEWKDKIDVYTWRSDGISEVIVHVVDNATILQIGANEKEEMRVTFGEISCSSLGIRDVSVATLKQASSSLGKIDVAIGIVSKCRARLGAYQNRLEHTISNLITSSTNTAEAESRIRDADMAREMAEFTKLNILSQAGNSMLPQANQMPQNVMSLLRE